MRPPRVLAAALVLAPAAAMADDASAWLLQVSDAARAANYQGVLVYRDGQRMEVMRVIHRLHGGQIQERLTSLTGKPRDILREGDQVACLVGDEPVQPDAPQGLLPELTREQLDGAATHYEFRDLGQARVAGRPCRGVLLAPKDQYRYGYEICGDTQTAVPLRVTLLDQHGHTIEQMMFTEVAFPAQIADAAFAPPPGVTPVPAAVAAPTPAAAAAEAAEKARPPSNWQPISLPPGFRVILRNRTVAPNGQGIVEHLLLSDGLSVVSVFGAREIVTENAPERAFHGVSQMGAVNAYGRHVGTFHITVVGEVPASTVRMIGDGLSAPVEAEAEPASLSH